MLWGLLASLGITTIVLENPALAIDLSSNVRPFYSTVGNPYNSLANDDPFLSGVAKLSIAKNETNAICSGALLNTGFHVLTAAHCLTDAVGNFDVDRALAQFGDESFAVNDYYIHEGWQGYSNITLGYDIAILELSESVGDNIARYDLSTEIDPVGTVGYKAGYGWYGVGDFGTIGDDGQLRSGYNRYDATGDLFSDTFGLGKVSESLLVYDFDNGKIENDALGQHFGVRDLGEGDSEVMAYAGDSGGPTFVNGAIAAITSFGFGGTEADINDTQNSSFGEFGFDTNIAFHAAWIDRQLQESRRLATARVPEPSTVSVIILTGLFLFGKGRCG